MKFHSLGRITGGQDGVICNGYLFRFGSKGNCNVFYLKDCLQDAPEPRAPIARFVLDKADELMPHSNAVAFGTEYYAPQDEFPLLYTNLYNSYADCEDKMEGVTCVYRLWRQGCKSR